MAEGGKWRCGTCCLTWEASLIKCKACESFKPGLSEADIAAIQAEEERQRQDNIAKFRQPADSGAPKPTGFGVPSAPSFGSSGGSGFTFGAPAGDSAAAPVAFGAGPSSGQGASPFAAGTGASFGFGFGAAAGTGAAAPVAFGSGTAAGGASSFATGTGAGFSFGFGAPAGVGAAAPVAFGSGTAVGGAATSSSGTGFSFGAGAGAPAFQPSAGQGFGFAPAAAAAPAAEEKELDQLPDFGRDAEVPLGDVFVHGSGECDQLGLGDAQRERKKPTLMKSLSGLQIIDLAVGALHVVCVTLGGRLLSWGCNDDGALGRSADGGSDCEPHAVAMPASVAVQRVSCGDNHSCALDTRGRVWLWGTYKDSNGHIGIARKRKQQGEVCEKSAEPAVVLEGCSQIASGANHTLALAAGPPPRKAFAWGSNATGQLGLESGAGCGFEERILELPAAGEQLEGLGPREGGGSEIGGERVVRVREASGRERSAASMSPAQVRQALTAGSTALILEVPERDVPKPERQGLLLPQEVSLGGIEGNITGVFASAECTFLLVDAGVVYGCGLNGDGQVGLGFASMAVRTPRPLPQPRGAAWLGGGLHFTAALVDGKVVTWGKADECGHGLGSTAAPVLEPRAVAGLPEIRSLRCGGSHALACSAKGDVFAWGCGLTYQLANRPRDSANPADAEEDPEDELRPYRLSSKQLDKRFVLLADGGAQHSVELAWGGQYGDHKAALAAQETAEAPAADAEAAGGSGDERPAKRRAANPMPEEGQAAGVSDTASAAEAVGAAEAGPEAPQTLGFLAQASGGEKWRCDTCALMWEMSLIKCKACENFRPGLSEQEVAEIQAEEERRRQENINKFRQPVSAGAQPTGFSLFGGAAPAAGAAPVVFGAAPSGAAAGTASAASAGSTASSGFGFGSFGSSGFGGFSGFGAGGSTSSTAAPAIFGSGPASSGGLSFGFGGGAGGGFTPSVVEAAAAPKLKQLAELPDLTKQGEVPLGDIFVHGSGECDQLGLGDTQRERKKPTLVKPLASFGICDVAVGALHVVCAAANGLVFSWGCNDDGALGRPADGSTDCRPGRVAMPSGVAVRKVSCGDNHSCALDSLGRVWLWGTYKDSNGHIGIARKRKLGPAVAEKSHKPAVVLEGCVQIASGANHTLALGSLPSGKVYAWGSNATGQLSIESGAGCGFDEVVLEMQAGGSAPESLRPHAGGGTEVDGQRVVRIREASGKERSAATLSVEKVQQAVSAGAAALILEVPERDVPKPERQALLLPQEADVHALAGPASGVFAAAECTFVTAEGGAVYGCGLNGDGQVGLGFASMAVRTLRPLPQLQSACWLGGGLHSSAALVEGQVFTWGKADECGQGLGASAPPVLEPRKVAGLPSIRTLRCGGSHTLACSGAGDVFVWGCGLTYQLANRPRDSAQPGDAEEDPEDELKPYCISSKQLDSRFVLLADGGAQHSVELAWRGGYAELSCPPGRAGGEGQEEAAAGEESDAGEPPAKQRRAEPSPPPAEAEAAAPPAATEAAAAPAAVAVEEPAAEAAAAEAAAEPSPSFGCLLAQPAPKDVWKCDLCSCTWPLSLIKCKACESFQPGLSEEAVAEIQAEEERKRQADIAKFRQPAASTVAPTGFSVPAAPGSGTGFAFGAGAAPAAAAPVAFGFGAGTAPAAAAPIAFGSGAGAAPAAAAPVAFGFGASTAPTPAAPAPIAFGFGVGAGSGADAAPAPVAFGFGAGGGGEGAGPPLAFGFGAEGGGGGFRPKAVAAPTSKELSELPDLGRDGEVPLGDVFVHGSGECDQLGLGDAQRERKKPTILKSLSGFQVCDLAVGALHVVAVTTGGQLFSWGCNDDGALGRSSDHGSDCEPHAVALPAGVAARRVSCGDNHTCALDSLGRVWLWGTYKDSNGHIGIARKRKQQGAVCEKSAEPAVVLEGCSQIASGANHTMALTTAEPRRVFSWGSNGTGQLGLLSGAGCGMDERVLELPAGGASPPELRAREGGGVEVEGQRLVRVRTASGDEQNAMSMTLAQVRQAISAGAAALVLEVPEREVPKTEKQGLLLPQEVYLGDINAEVDGIFASAECTFVTAAGSRAYGCGLNGDGQVGLGFASLAVKKLRWIPNVNGASWLGGGLHSSAALIQGRVFAWGKADECGLGLSSSAPPVLEPRSVEGLAGVRTLRCGGSHSLACSEAGDVFAWGCGLTYQLANRPRDSAQPKDAEEDPEDELRPYRVSSKQLEKRFVLLADGGAQHSVELAWNGSYAALTAPPAAEAEGEVEEAGEAADEPPAKRRATESTAPAAPVATSKAEVLAEAAQAAALPVPSAPAAAARRVQADVAARLQKGAAKVEEVARRVEAEVLRLFTGSLLSEAVLALPRPAAEPAAAGRPPRRVLWSPREPASVPGEALEAPPA